MQNQAYKAHKFVSLEADIEALKQKVDIKIAEKDMQIAELKKDVTFNQLQCQTIKQWIDELRDKFMMELSVLSENNMTLQTSCNLLQERLRVLSSVKQQLKSSMIDDVEVDGIFVSNTIFDTMISDVVDAGEKMWEMIRKRLLTVMQRPFQMFQLKDEEQSLALEIDSIKQQLESLQLKSELESKEKDLMEVKMKQMQKKLTREDQWVQCNLQTEREAL